MNTIALACQTISEEVMLVINALEVPFPVLWVDAGLHNFPEKLSSRLQEEINRIENVDQILLLFGLCGNALLGLVSQNAHLIIPRVDDCISLLLGGNEQRNLISHQDRAYFLTKGMLTYENNLRDEFFRCIKKYGYQKTQEIFRLMLKNYKNLDVIDTGAYNLAELLPKTEKLATELDLSHKIVSGSLKILFQAFRGEWDKEFAVIKPGQIITLRNLNITKAAEPFWVKTNNL